MGNMHSLLNTLMLMISIQPYRKAFIMMILGIIKKMHIPLNNSSVSVNEVSHKNVTTIKSTL